LVRVQVGILPTRGEFSRHENSPLVISAPAALSRWRGPIRGIHSPSLRSSTPTLLGDVVMTRPPSARPCLEVLEDRTLFPAVLVRALGLEGGTGLSGADASGSGNNGTISGATWAATGRFGKALSFDGASNWVTVADSASLDLSSGMTLEGWVRPAAVSGWRT